MDYALDGTNPLQMTLIGRFRLVQHHQHLLAHLLVKGDQVRFTESFFFSAYFIFNAEEIYLKSSARIHRS